MTLRRDRSELAAAAALTAALAIFTWHVSHHWFSTSDTGQLLYGVGAVDACLHNGTLVDCRSAGFGDPSHFPLLQYLPALALKWLGASIQQAYQGLCWLNAAAFLGLLGLLWHAGRRLGGTALGSLLLLTGITSPLLWYSHGGFGEPLAALAGAAFVTGLALRWHPAITAGALFCAAIAKEPILPVLVMLGAAVIAARPAGRRISRSELVALGAAVVGALAASAAFNVFRYGGPANDFYLADAVQPPLADRASAFAAMLVAPNVGLLWFWPSALVVAAAAVAAARRTAWRALVVVAVAFAALLVGLASFWGPFGWEAWGPRLLLPWIPAFLIAIAAICGRALADALAEFRAARPFLAVLAALMVIMCTVPQVAVFRDWQLGFALFDPGRSCPINLPEIREYRAAFGSTDGYYRCLRRQAWTHPPTLLHAADRLDRAGIAWGAVLTVLTAMLLARGGLALHRGPPSAMMRRA